MPRLLALILLLAVVLICGGCDDWLDDDVPAPPPAKTTPCPDGRCPTFTIEDGRRLAGQPPMDLPILLRQANYSGGSCVHAAMISCLRWQGLSEWADWWRQEYAGGESLKGLVAKSEHNGLRYAYTGTGQAEFLDWASRTRRGAVIFYWPNHAVNFCGYENGQAVLLDNNRTAQYVRIPREQFLKAWKGYGGVALTPVYSPVPPDATL